ncbi:MAG: hypothetical protein LBG59_04440 [Candidatus Peribacteria bacterium]|jgi:hypothetical protein|nr:hypothetical protein [Candidatus Peribacteria bacterium]
MYSLTIESFDSLPQGQTAFQVYFPIKTDFFYLPKEVVVRGNQEKNVDNSLDENYLYLLIDNEVQLFPVQL